MIAINGAAAILLLALAFGWTILRHRRRELEAARASLDEQRVVRGPWNPRLVDERRAQNTLRPRTGLVAVQPVDPPEVKTRAQVLNEAFQRGDGMGAA